VTAKASGTLINISGHSLMFLIHIRLIMCMAENALENLVIVGIHMTIGTNIPSALMPAGVNGEVLRVMIPGSLIPCN
jgi:hypothetical protein